MSILATPRQPPPAPTRHTNFVTFRCEGTLADRARKKGGSKAGPIDPGAVGPIDPASQRPASLRPLRCCWVKPSRGGCAPGNFLARRPLAPPARGTYICVEGPQNESVHMMMRMMTTRAKVLGAILPVLLLACCLSAPPHDEMVAAGKDACADYGFYPGHRPVPPVRPEGGVVGPIPPGCDVQRAGVAA
jgi:hypothetical protein